MLIILRYFLVWVFFIIGCMIFLGFHLGEEGSAVSLAMIIMVIILYVIGRCVYECNPSFKSLCDKILGKEELKEKIKFQRGQFARNY